MNEPIDKDISQYMNENKLDYYNAREALREEVYRQQYPYKPLWQSWGDFFKSM